jgi:uncharacterized protein YlzI (FlbEa/FlbD family)
MKFINLLYPDNTTTWVNIEHIVAFEREGEVTNLVLSNGNEAQVRETPLEILEKLQ